MKYTFEVLSVGENVLNFINTNNSVNIFDEGCSEGLAEMSIVHTKSELKADIAVGDTLEWGAYKFKIIDIGKAVNKNIKETGHCTIVFNGKVTLPGQMAVEGMYIPHFRTGENVSIY